MVNQSAIDRGYFRSVFFRTYNNKEGAEEEFKQINTRETQGCRHGPYDKLDYDGLISPGTQVSGDDIIIGKVRNLTENVYDAQGVRGQSTTMKDASEPLRHSEAGMIDQVMLTRDDSGYRFVKVKMRTIKVPQIGDKFASRHGQKGTCGMTYR